MTSIASIAAPSQAGFNVRRIREDFPILRQTVHGKPLVYLDNAATAQKPRAVLDALMAYYSEDNANVHRGVHLLSERATQAFEDARAAVQRFIGAASPREIIFTRNATAAINLVAQTFGRTRLGPGDEVVISAMEHHSNIVPWQMICQEKGASLRVFRSRTRGPALESTSGCSAIHAAGRSSTCRRARDDQSVQQRFARPTAVVCRALDDPRRPSMALTPHSTPNSTVHGTQLYDDRIGVFTAEHLLEKCLRIRWRRHDQSVTFERPPTRPAYNSIGNAEHAARLLAAAVDSIPAIVWRRHVPRRELLAYSGGCRRAGVTLVGTPRERDVLRS